MEFRGHDGTCFDSLVIGAYIPPEPEHEQLEQSASLLVIVEPMPSDVLEPSPPKQQPSHSKALEASHVRRPHKQTHDGMSVGSSDISPSDSISNVRACQ